jgi:DNA-binding NtrC family response regulator
MIKSTSKTWVITAETQLIDALHVLESLKNPLGIIQVKPDAVKDLNFKPKSNDILMIHIGSPGLDFNQVTDLVQTLKNTISPKRMIVIDDEYSSKRGFPLLSAGVKEYLARPLNLNHLDLILNVLKVDVSLEKEVSIKESERAGRLNQEPVQLDKNKKFASFLVDGGGDLHDNLMKSVFRVAKSNTTVLLAGETGTGKSHLAKVIHHSGDRSDKPFITINCAAISPTLFESELFGHVKGAFTGADTDRNGKLTDAAEGTIFLDEIDSLPLPLQAKLLRVFEEKVYEPVGSNKSLPMKARLIVASNRDLKKEVAEGRFRSDLFYRLNVVSFEIPSLRSRKMLVPGLIQRFLDETTSRMSVSTPNFTDEAFQLMQNYNWPGNIRELRNVIERAVALCEHNTITVQDLTPDMLHHFHLQNPSQSTIPLFTDEVDGQIPTVHKLSNVVETQERETILDCLSRNRFNMLRSAKALGISRMTLYKKIEKYQIVRKSSELQTPYNALTAS